MMQRMDIRYYDFQLTTIAHNFKAFPTILKVLELSADFLRLCYLTENSEMPNCKKAFHLGYTSFQSIPFLNSMNSVFCSIAIYVHLPAQNLHGKKTYYSQLCMLCFISSTFLFLRLRFTPSHSSRDHHISIGFLLAE